MQQQNELTIGPDTRLHPTQHCRLRADLLGVDINDVLDIPRRPDPTTQSAQGTNQMWYLGETGAGRTLKVLVEHRSAQYARVVTIRELK